MAMKLLDLSNQCKTNLLLRWKVYVLWLWLKELQYSATSGYLGW